MKSKKVKILIAAGALIVIALAAIFIPKLVKDKPAPTDSETSSTRSAWLDETYPQDEPDTENDEHTLPMVTVA